MRPGVAAAELVRKMCQPGGRTLLGVAVVSKESWCLETRRGNFFQNGKNPLENIGSETNSPGKPRSRVCEAALRAPVATAPGGVAFEQTCAFVPSFRIVVWQALRRGALANTKLRSKHTFGETRAHTNTHTYVFT